MQEPPLLAAGFLVDLVAAQQLFAFHLPEMCKKRSKSSSLFNTIADYARLHGSILSVLGYFPKQEVRICSAFAARLQIMSTDCDLPLSDGSKAISEMEEFTDGRIVASANAVRCLATIW